MTLRVNNFGGGVVIAGSPDARNTNELLQADAVDIGSRGTLICASDTSDYVQLADDASAFYTRLFGLFSVVAQNYALVVAVGESLFSGVLRFVWSVFDRQGSASPVAIGGLFGVETGSPIAGGLSGAVVTQTSFPGKFQVKFPAGAVQTINIHLVNIGARERFGPLATPGLYVFATVPPSLLPTVNQIMRWDALGTGSSGSLPVGGGAAGTKARQLYFRGIISYNNHVWGWGFDSSDVAGDGPNRIMFCNQGNPLKWGNDQGADGTDREFTDSDAIVLGDAGEIVRAACKWRDRLWFGTNQQIHWLAGYGRDSWTTDAAHPTTKAFNVLGPHNLIEGPDAKLYGWGDQGLWSTADGNLFTPLFERLRDFGGKSNGYFDCVWSDPTQPLAAFPGRTNQDLTWMAVDRERSQVIMGIPWCNAVQGFGYGLDTVVIKYHTITGGFTRQMFYGVQYTAAAYLRAEGQQPATQMWGTATPNKYQVQRFGYKATNNASPRLPRVLPHIEAGPFMPYGGDGDGTLQAVYLTLAWEGTTSLQLVFRVSVIADSGQLSTFRLFIQPNRPLQVSEDDLWLDTSQTDTNIGNGVSAVGIPARGGYLLKQRRGIRWRQLPGGGDVGTRASIRLPYPRVIATRYSFDVQTLTASNRFEFEALGLNPGAGSAEGGAG